MLDSSLPIGSSVLWNVKTYFSNPYEDYVLPDWLKKYTYSFFFFPFFFGSFFFLFCDDPSPLSCIHLSLYCISIFASSFFSRFPNYPVSFLFLRVINIWPLCLWIISIMNCSAMSQHTGSFSFLRHLDIFWARCPLRTWILSCNMLNLLRRQELLQVVKRSETWQRTPIVDVHEESWMSMLHGDRLFKTPWSSNR